MLDDLQFEIMLESMIEYVEKNGKSSFGYNNQLNNELSYASEECSSLIEKFLKKFKEDKETDVDLLRQLLIQVKNERAAKPNNWVWTQKAVDMGIEAKAGDSVGKDYLREGRNEFMPNESMIYQGYVEKIPK